MCNFAIVITLVLLLQLCVAEVRDRNTNECGVPQIKTINLMLHGHETVPGAWPWHAAIIHLKGHKESYACGGTLLTERYVLTAAHCLMDDVQQQLSEKKIFIRLGIHNLRQMGSTLQNHSIAKIYIHPNYTSPLVWDDIGILELQTQAEFNDYVQLACLGLTYDLTGIYGTVIGWGRTEDEEYSSNLKSSRMPVIDVYTCLDSDRETYGLTLTKNILCAGYTNGTKVCNGDSGSGLFFKHNNVWFLGGIVSFTAVYLDSNGYHVCNKNGYGAFTNVHSYLPWISSITGLKFDAFLPMTVAQTSYYRQNQNLDCRERKRKPAHPASYYECCNSNPHIRKHHGTNFDEWECLCRTMHLARDTCEADIHTLLQSRSNLKLCRDSPQRYIADNICHSEREWAESNDPTGKAIQFALDLFRTADPHLPNENFIVSPLSLQVLLSQLLDGCSESARNEVIKSVKLNSIETAMLVKALIAAANKDISASNVQLASGFFLSNNFNITDNFNSARKLSKTPLMAVDFSNTHETAATVNKWVTEKTRGNIKEVVTEQNLSPDMSMLLLNAIHFKGTWQYKFNKSRTNKRAIFKHAENEQMSVHMMSQTNKLRFGEINYRSYSDPKDGLRWVELPYDGDQLSMIFLLPKTRFALDDMLARVNGDHLLDIFNFIKQNYNPINIHLQVPRFTIKNSISLVEPLKKLGVKQIFENEDALSALSSTPARVGDVIHNAFLSVDEAGTVATAVTNIIISPANLVSYGDVAFVCDEPFMVMVVDKTSKIPLFMAKITQPFSTRKTQNRG